MLDEKKSVFTEMRRKDPHLYGSLVHLPLNAVLERWVEKYPDDFPLRGATPIADASAIKAKQ